MTPGIYLFLFIFFLQIPALSLFSQSADTLSQYHFNLENEENKTYLLSDNDNSYWLGKSHGYNLQPHLGFTFRQQPVLKDLFVFVNGDLLPRDEARVIVSPVDIRRNYPESGISEHLMMLKNRGALVYEIAADSSDDIIILPAFFSPTFDPVMSIETEGDIKKIIQPLYRTEADLPVSAHMAVSGRGKWYREDSTLTWQIPSALQLDHPIQWIGSSSDTLRVFFTLSSDVQQHKELVKEWKSVIADGRKINPVVTTDNQQINKSLYWTEAHLNNLQMTQNETGIFAGLPAADFYSARDSFLGITGLALIQGQYDFARRLFRRFAEFQVTSRSDSAYGKIPSSLIMGYPDYSAADSAPLFTLALYEYLRYSGEFVLLREMFPVIRNSIEGTLSYRTDPERLLVHGNADTWMDAVGQNGACSPRGDRAVEIQFMWYQQLRTGAALAEELGEFTLAEQWNTAAAEVGDAILKRYWLQDKSRFIDHVNPDGTADTFYRPNVFLGARLTRDLLPAEQQEAVLRNVLSKNAYSWGISTLHQENDHFHPYMKVPRYDSVNPSRHNGVIYPWLKGSLVTQLIRFNHPERAFDFIRLQTWQILTSFYAGGLAESINVFLETNWRATSRDNLPEHSGSGIHTLALAEYIRNWHQDILGIDPDAFENVLALTPQLPEDIREASTSVNFSGNAVDIHYESFDSLFVFELQNRGNPFTVDLQFRVDDSLYVLNQPFQLAAIPGPIVFHFDKYQKAYSLYGRKLPSMAKPVHGRKGLLQNSHTQQPNLLPGLPALQSPDYRLLRADEVALSDTSLRAIVDLQDPPGDDYGPEGTYVYPSHAFFVDGIFDLTNFRVRSDETHVYFEIDFRELVQPGWHPEYGFQLTYAAIGIHTGDEDIGTWNFGQHANHRVDAEIPMQYIIYIGGGIQIADMDGNIIAEYRPKPGDTNIGDLRENQIRFAIPLDIIPQPKRWWQYTVISGGQDDHQGGGIGMFRRILPDGQLWYGGGRQSEDAPNWYDIMSFGY